MDLTRKSTAALLAVTLAGGAGIGAVASTPMAALAADASAQSTPRSPSQWVTDSLKGLVNDGTITQSQSDAVREALVTSRPEHPHKGVGKRSHGGPPAVTGVGEVLGMSPKELRAALRGKSLADVAREKNVDLQKVIDAIVTAQNVRIDRAVTNGRITPEVAAEQKAKAVDRANKIVNGVRPERPGQRGGARDQGAPTDRN